MQIRHGTTRLVVLHGRYAYKFARIRPLKTVLKIIVMSVSQRQQALLCEKYDRRFGWALWKYLFAGLYSNWAEYHYWHATFDERCAPAVRMYFHGVLVVQLRALPASREDVECSELRALLHEPELTKSRQYGLLDGKCVIIDYAHWGIST